MPTPTAEQILLARFVDKCQMAGGLRAGFVLRRAALLYVKPEYPDLDLESGIDALVEGEILKTSETGDFLFLTAAGVAALEAPGTSAK